MSMVDQLTDECACSFRAHVPAEQFVHFKFEKRHPTRSHWSANDAIVEA
jgi:hypothetical protein